MGASFPTTDMPTTGTPLDGSLTTDTVLITTASMLIINATDKSTSTSSNMATVIGPVVGSLVFIFVLLGLYFLRHKKEVKVTKDDHPPVDELANRVVFPMLDNPVFAGFEHRRAESKRRINDLFNNAFEETNIDQLNVLRSTNHSDEDVMPYPIRASRGMVLLVPVNEYYGNKAGGENSNVMIQPGEYQLVDQDQVDSINTMPETQGESGKKDNYDNSIITRPNPKADIELDNYNHLGDNERVVIVQGILLTLIIPFAHQLLPASSCSFITTITRFLSTSCSLPF